MNRSHFSLALTGMTALTLAACSSGARDASDSAAAPADSTATATGTTVAPASDTGAASGTGGATASAGAMLDPNTATREQLTSVPGVPAHVADAIIAGRPFNTMVDVDKALAAHASEGQRDSVYARVWKPIDLNRASGEEILLIPGVGARMRHEFEEYRPYRSMAQFRREIGKYVNEAEVARLERYVTIGN
jgi:DNA uptake protein ComE-like DNA-binding protein